MRWKMPNVPCTMSESKRFWAHLEALEDHAAGDEHGAVDEDAAREEVAEQRGHDLHLGGGVALKVGELVDDVLHGAQSLS